MPDESLRYTVSYFAPTSAVGPQINFAIVKFINQGAKAAREAHGIVKFTGDVEITEHQIDSLSNLSISDSAKLSSDKRTFDLIIPSLLPNEIVTSYFLLHGSNMRSPDVYLRSTDTIGKELELSSSANDSDGRLRSIPAAVTVASAVLIQAILFALFLENRYILRDTFGSSSIFGSANNSAFVLAHSGAPIDAKNILKERIIRKGGGGPYELANYGLALGLLGQINSEEYFRASEMWAKSNHVKAVIRFNRAAISASQGDWVETERYLRACPRK